MENKNKSIPVTKDVKKFNTMQGCATDPNGSYTGVPKNPHDVPVQDSDDL